MWQKQEQGIINSSYLTEQNDKSRKFGVGFIRHNITKNKNDRLDDI